MSINCLNSNIGYRGYRGYRRHNGKFACLGTVEIPGNKYYITEYDGVEEVHYPKAEGSWIVIDD